MNMNDVFENFGIAIEHLKGSKFGEMGTEDGFEVNGDNIVDALNEALANYGLKITYMDGVE